MATCGLCGDVVATVSAHMVEAHEHEMRARRLNPSDAVVASLARLPKYHHPTSQGIVQRSLLVLDEAVPARVGGVETTLPAGTCISVTAGGIGSRGRMAWHGRMMDGPTVEIDVAP